MKTCLIYGHGGLDLDVTFNVLHFYKSLGFKTFFSENLYDADLLVVLRATNKKIDISPYSFSLVHVFDYGGWEYDKFICSIDNTKTYIFCSAESKKEGIITRTNFPENQIFCAFPPIHFPLWIKKLKKTKYNLIHIGNYKPITDTDTVKENFNKSIPKLKVHIWGAGWNGKVNDIFYHGKTSFLNVSNIYAQSESALGLMYPFQRDVTFSGRFWHAPLNGCFIFSEPGLYTKEIPGIIETDFSIEDISRKQEEQKENISREELQQKAKEYWITSNESTLNYIKPSLSLIGKRKFSITKLKNYIFVCFFNKIRILNQEPFVNNIKSYGRLFFR